MPLTDRERHDAYEAMRDAFGERTDTVIQLLRPDYDDLVTKDDLDRGLSELRFDLRSEIAELRIEFKTEIHSAFAAQTRTMMIGLVSAVLLIALSNTLAVLVG